MYTSLYLYLGSFIAGVVTGSIIEIPYLSFLAPSLAVIIFSKGRRRKKLAVTVMLFLLGLGRAGISGDPSKRFGNNLGESRDWTFWVCRDPEPLWDGQSTVLCLTGKDGGQKGKAAVKLPLYPRVAYGDGMRLHCRLERPPSFEGFDYAAYLAAQGIGAVCSFPLVISVEEGVEGREIMRSLFSLKRWALEIINEALPEPAAGLGSALLLGYKKTLVPEADEDFKRAGLSHIVAISGGHISLFLELMIAALAYLRIGKRRAMWPAILGAFIYVIMTGMQASAWRSFIMGALALWSWRQGKPRSIWLLMLIAAAIMLVEKPMIWRYDLGFQLSFLAIAGMAALEPEAASKIYPYESGFGRFAKTLRSAFRVSLAAQLAVWPLLALQGSGISLISPFSNVLAFWVFGPLVIWLLIALVASCLCGAFYIFWLPGHALLAYLLKIGEICAHLPLAFIPSDWFRPWMAIIYYSLGIFCLIIRKK
ncbi:MAG: ComEC/Rec2 family competence protein [Bacillota bacterium]